MMVDFQKLCDFYKLGKLLSEPEWLEGGRSHDVCKIQTEQGPFVVKRLLQKEMATLNLDLYRNTQAIAMLARKSGLPVLSAILNDKGDVIYEQGDAALMLFPYLSAKRQRRKRMTLTQCTLMGEFLASMHGLDLVVPCAQPWEFSFNQAQWDIYLAYANDTLPSIATLLAASLDQIKQCYAMAAQKDQQDIVVSHRDLGVSNILWHSDTQFFVIDWDCTGKVDAAVELLFLGLGFAMETNSTLNFDKLQAVFRAYCKHRPLKVVSPEWVLSRVLVNWLDWVGHEFEHLMTPGLTLAEKTITANEILNSLSSFAYIHKERAAIFTRTFTIC